nr:Chain H1, Nup145N/Nup100/Nup116 R2 [Saccharomyces cerevisiae]7TBI_H2 Chain H2, Nup145N/Nup100/Nup116 R2 [Saccharomyces cerevisiae]7TBJ_H1 Chain H1, NUP98 R2 [Homo sapiens]7TBJ_H2 Chain H2, NUP98 R2 [Homo sapiens]7TBK_H1 Chain H1, NUP98 R2 [Homo sapiens]7TBK_H2 Chain H2, NUP98 R2 [Homo sapiens]7TBL_H1 Chain H1, NUP98 R2 [Homo sapiens]7TBL_H2 Chain H2, NUP98 R2 [Homo sapiens]7TBM_H1 Chain H1, NUP98 R2 [Homo sapiens]7TBM_H2 Chain H2, NUP98 R2 [Homo sapiens]
EDSILQPGAFSAN